MFKKLEVRTYFFTVFPSAKNIYSIYLYLLETRNTTLEEIDIGFEGHRSKEDAKLFALAQGGVGLAAFLVRGLPGSNNQGLENESIQVENTHG